MASKPTFGALTTAPPPGVPLSDYGALVESLRQDLQLSLATDIQQHTGNDAPVWTALPYSANWHASSVGADWTTPSIFVDANGWANLTGLVAPTAAYAYGAASAVVLNLPPAQTPNRTQMVLVMGQDSASNYFIARMDIAGAHSGAYPPGQVLLVANIAGANNGLAGYINLHNVRFPTNTP